MGTDRSTNAPLRALLGAGGVVALAVLGGFGVVTGGRPISSPKLSITDVATTTPSTTSTSSGTSTTTSTTTSATTTTTSTESNQPLQTLYRLLPPGYDSTNCTPASNPNGRALATVDCGQTSDPNSPPTARFSILPDLASLASEFQAGVNEDSAKECPGGPQSPTTWHQDATPDVPAGSLLCGTFNDVPDLMWTKDDGLLLGDLQGPDLTALYQHWLSF